jgi:PAS domain-containing protein
VKVAIVEVKFDDDRPVDYRFLEANPAFERQAGVDLRTVSRIVRKRFSLSASRASASRRSVTSCTVPNIRVAFAIVEVKFDDDRPVDYRFLEANPAFERQAGVDRPETLLALGQPGLGLAALGDVLHRAEHPGDLPGGRRGGLRHRRGQVRR